jgi:hypothetical protein
MLGKETMKHIFSILAVFIIFSSCAQNKEPLVPLMTDTSTDVDIKYSNILARTIPDTSATDFYSSYATLKLRIENKRLAFFNAYTKANTDAQRTIVLDSAYRYLHSALVQNIFLYWYGTQWDFNGISDQPQQGFIACGYFVSTTLKHSGVHLNRYKLAQQYSHSIVNTLCADVKKYTQLSTLLQYINTQPDNLYVVGLDNHVGYISKQNNNITFIHSSFVGSACVESEAANASAVLASSRLYVLGNLSGNKKLVLNWLQGTFVTIVP